MSKFYIQVTDEEAEKLYNSLLEVEMTRTLYEVATRQMDFSPEAFKILIMYLNESYKIYKIYWNSILTKYLGEDDTSRYFNILRFNPIKKVIYNLEIEGCPLCTEQQ